REKDVIPDSLSGIWSEIKQDYPEEWLLPLEILELAMRKKEYHSLETEIRDYLINVKGADPELKRLIENGMLVSNSSEF
ncbi:MAG: hypothetical protein WC594_13680, partial [Thermodesulfovibrionales bacterium]